MKIYLIGDSISIHYGPYLKEFLAGWLEYSRKEGEDEALLNLDKPQGANGGDSSMLRKFLEAKSRGEGIDADLLLLNCGLHDIKTDPQTGQKQIPINEYRENLEEIIRLVSKMKTKLVWIRTTPCDEKIHNAKQNNFYRFAADCLAYNAVADEIMTAHGIKSIDLHALTLNLGDNIYCDHVHFHDHIRREQAAFIAGWLSRDVQEYA